MKRLLIVSPHFPPTNAVDMHRIRTSLPYYGEFGYEPSVLAFEHDCTDHKSDAKLLDTVGDASVLRIRCIPRWLGAKVGIGSVSFRGMFSMRRALKSIVGSHRPDVVFFSTTSFPLMLLGGCLPRSIPFVLDFQDPWVSPQGSIHEPTLKHRVVHALHKRLERMAVPGASGLISVSGDYLEVLARRYGAVSSIPTAVIPFGWSKIDLEIAQSSNLEDPAFPSDMKADLASKIVGLYAGAYVSSMRPMVAKFFEGICKIIGKSPEVEESLRIWFIGSNYLASESTPLTDLASQYGLSGIVREFTGRLPLHQVLAAGFKSSFNLLFGSTSRWYNPSKLFSLLAVRKPVIGVVEGGTEIERLLAGAGGSIVIDINKPESLTEAVDELKLVIEGVYEKQLRGEFLNLYSAREMTRKQSQLFDLAIRFKSA